MSIVNKLVEGGHLTPEQVERIGESVHEFMKEADANPAIVDEYLEKAGVTAGAAAAAQSVWKPIALAGGISLGASVAGALGSLGLEAARDWYHDIAKAKRYKKMIEANPELKMRGVNSKLVQMHFGTLNKFNPDYAKDPMVAGAYVQNQLEAARPNIESLNNIVAARKNMAQVEDLRKFKQPGEIASRVGETAAKRFMPEQPAPERYPAMARMQRAAATMKAQNEIEAAIDKQTASLADPAQGGMPGGSATLRQQVKDEYMKPYGPMADKALEESQTR